MSLHVTYQSAHCFVHTVQVKQVVRHAAAKNEDEGCMSLQFQGERMVTIARAEPAVYIYTCSQAYKWQSRSIYIATVLWQTEVLRYTLNTTHPPLSISDIAVHILFTCDSKLKLLKRAASILQKGFDIVDKG